MVVTLEVIGTTREKMPTAVAAESRLAMRLSCAEGG